MPAMWARAGEGEERRCASTGWMQVASCVGSRQAPPWM
jgi:hypothetical protein